MKIVTVVVRILLGVVFFVFGLNGFVGFIPTPPLPGTAGAFIGAMASSHYLYLVAGVQLIAGVLLLTNQFVPLAVAMLANILAYHLTMQMEGLPMALITALLWAVLAWRYRAHFGALFVQKAG